MADWGWGAPKEESEKIFRVYVDSGGNFVDTSINYADGTSEKFLGEFLEGDRDRFVIATKYTLTTRKSDPNAGGNHRKNMMRSLETSLKRLKTDYLDLYWLHMWDYTTPIKEVMRALDDVVRSGKVHYVGVSDTGLGCVPCERDGRVEGMDPVRGATGPVQFSPPGCRAGVIPYG